MEQIKRMPFVRISDILLILCFVLGIGKAQANNGTVRLVPAINALSASTLCVNDTLVITGTDLQNPAEVRMAGILAMVVSSKVDTIWALVPNTNVTAIGKVEVQRGVDQAFSANDITINPLPAKPDITVIGNTAFCSGETVQLVATAGAAQYQWTKNDIDTTITTQVASIDSTGIYKVTFIDARGCKSVSSPITVQVNPLPVAVIRDDTTICMGEQVPLITEVTSGTPAYQYEWSPSMGLSSANVQSPTAQPANTQTYMLTVTDANGCKSLDEMMLTVTDTPSVFIVTTDSDSSICQKDSISFITSGPTGTLYEFFVDDVSQGPASEVKQLKIGGLTTGAHRVYAKGTFNNCTGTTGTLPIDVKELTDVSIINPTQITFTDARDTVQLVGSPSGGVFSGIGVINNVFYPSFVGVDNSPYTLTYAYETPNGCVSTTDIILSVVDDANAITGLNTLYCIQDEPDTLSKFNSPIADAILVNLINVTAVGEGISPNVANAEEYIFSPQSLEVGSYNIQAIYRDTLTGLRTQRLQVLTIAENPSVSFTGLDAAYCAGFGPLVQLEGSQAGGVFSGEGVRDTGLGQAGFILQEAGIGTHTVSYSFTDANGCSNTATQQVTVHRPPTVSFTNLNPAYCYNADTVVLEANFNGGEFNGNGVSDNGDGTAFFLASQAIKDRGILADSVLFNDINSNITYTYTDENGCSDEGVQRVDLLPLSQFSITVLDAFFEEPLEDAAICDTEGLLLNALLLPEEELATNGFFIGLGIEDNGDGTAYFSAGEALEAANITDPTLSATTYTIQYQYTGENGCQTTESAEVTVRKKPNPTIIGLDQGTYCVNGETLNIEYNSESIPFGVNFYLEGVNNEGLVDYDFGFAEFNPYAALIETGADPALDTVQRVLYMEYYDDFFCEAIVYDTITILPVEDVGISNIGPSPEFCYGDSAVLEGFPEGGIFSGDGIRTASDGVTTFYTDSALIAMEIGIPLYNLEEHTGYTYQYTSKNGCVASYAEQVTINPLPYLEIQELDSYYCINEDDEDNEIKGVSNSFGIGTFSGAIVIQDEDDEGDPFENDAGIFPLLLEEGGTMLNDSTTVYITYTFEDDLGCINSVIDSTIIRPRPVVSYTGVNEGKGYCDVDEEINLTLQPLPDELNTFGDFEGFGIDDSNKDGIAVFNPATAYEDYILSNPDSTVGHIAIEYEYEDEFSCSVSKIDTITVYPLPEVSIIGLEEDVNYCFSTSPFIIEGSPAKGVFTGNGVYTSGDTTYYSPRLAYFSLGLDSLNDLGIDRVVYTYVNENSCIDSAVVEVELRPVPTIGNFDDQSVCFNDSLTFKPSPQLLGNDDSAIFIGDGLTDLQGDSSVFVAATAARLAGAISSTDRVTSHQLTYKYTNSNGCVNQKAITVTVNSYTDVSISYGNMGVGDSLSYCEGTASFGIAPTVSIENASFIITGTGVVGNGVDLYEFIPTVARNTVISNDNALSNRQTQHPIRLSYTNEYSCTTIFRDTLYINPLPKVDFTLRSKCTEALIPFEDKTAIEGDVVLKSWGWEFGDEGISSLQNPSYQYQSSGSYNIKLTVTTEENCTNSMQKRSSIGKNPVAAFNFSQVCFGDTVLFSGKPSIIENTQIDTISTWQWDFANTGGETVDTRLDSAQHIFSAVGDYQVSLRVITNNDCENTITKRVSILETIDQGNLTDGIAYSEDFESDNGNWATEGANVSWDWGVPDSQANINAAGGGERAWVTNLAGDYNLSESSYVNGPCLDFRNLSRPMISMKVWSDTDSTRDGTVLQYSIDNGVSWENVGDLSSVYNWYDAGVRTQPGGNSVGLPAWTGKYGGWKVARHSLDELRNQPLVRFRIAFASDISEDGLDGFAFDDVWIGNRSKRVLIERFTNSSSTADAVANTTLNNLINSFEENDVVAIQYHLPSEATAAADPINLRNPTDPSGRALFYGVASTPSTVLDGEFVTNLSESLIEGRILGEEGLLGAAAFGVSLSFDDTPEDKLNINVRVEANQVFSEELSVQIVILERVVTAVQGANGEASFEWVMSKMVPNAAGTIINRNWQVGDNAQVSLSTSLVNIFDPSQVRVIAFVQNNTLSSPDFKKIYQTAYETPASLPPVVTAIKDVPKALAEASLYPNPANNAAYMAFGEALREPVQWALHDALGRKVVSGSLSQGSLGFSINTGKLATGMYFVKIANEKRILLYRKLMVNAGK